MSEFKCFAWYTKSMADDSPRGYIHAATVDGVNTACGLRLYERWWFSDKLFDNRTVDCPKCLRKIKNNE